MLSSLRVGNDTLGVPEALSAARDYSMPVATSWCRGNNSAIGWAHHPSLFGGSLPLSITALAGTSDVSAVATGLMCYNTLGFLVLSHHQNVLVQSCCVYYYKKIMKANVYQLAGGSGGEQC